MNVKTLRTRADGTCSSLRVIGFHGRLGLDQTPARRAPVYANAKGHLVTVLNASPWGSAGRHTLTVEVAPKKVSADTWATTATRVHPPWPAKLGDLVAIIGEREVGLAHELVARAHANVPERVTAFLRWITTDTARSTELRCARVDDLVAWYTTPPEVRALSSLIADFVRTEVLRCVQQRDPQKLASLSFWLSRAAVAKADLFLAVAGLRHASSPYWEIVFDAIPWGRVPALGRDGTPLALSAAISSIIDAVESRP